MASLSYDKVYSCFLKKVTDFDIANVSNDCAYSLMNEWFHSAASKSYFRRLFTTFTFDDEVMELEYVLKHISTSDEDEDFIIETLALGMVIEWLEPQLNSKLLTEQFVSSSKESRFFAQSNQLNAIQNVYDASYKKWRNSIKDRCYVHNSYLEGS